MQLENDFDACVTKVAPPPPAPDPEVLADQHKRHWTPLGMSQRVTGLFGWLFRFLIETGLWIVWANERWQHDTASIQMHRYCKATINHMLEHPDVSPDLVPACNVIQERFPWAKYSRSEEHTSEL